MCLLHFRFCVECNQLFPLPLSFPRKDELLDCTWEDTLCNNILCIRFQKLSLCLPVNAYVGFEGRCDNIDCSLDHCRIIRVPQNCLTLNNGSFIHTKRFKLHVLDSR